MPTNYEKVYQRQRHALGDPTKEFVVFFDQYEKQNAKVLDVGCGQGRDALFIARRGHCVVGIDISKTGIAQLLEDAHSEGLPVEGVVADISKYRPRNEYDIVVVDRTLHMLEANVRLSVLEWICRATREDGFVLIADEKSNLPSMKKLFEKDSNHWMFVKDRRGFLFVQKGA